MMTERIHLVNGTPCFGGQLSSIYASLVFADPATGTDLRGDFAFCKRWTDIGSEIWADLDSCLDHAGPSMFRGEVASQFAAAPVASAA
jgi:hypothetical protein